MKILRTVKRTVNPALFLISLVICYACSISYAQEPSYWPTNGWKVSTPEEQGINSQLLADGINEIIKKQVNLH